MNKKILIILIFTITILIIITLIFLNSDKNTHKLIADEKALIRSPNNVKIEVIESSISSTGVTILITDNNKHCYSWGEQFSIQEKINGQWQDLKYITDTVAFNEIAYALKNNQLTLKINWTNYYGELSNGTYRIVKQVYDGKYIDLYSNEFEV